MEATVRPNSSATFMLRLPAYTRSRSGQVGAGHPALFHRGGPQGVGRVGLAEHARSQGGVPGGVDPGTLVRIRSSTRIPAPPGSTAHPRALQERQVGPDPGATTTRSASTFGSSQDSTTRSGRRPRRRPARAGRSTRSMPTAQRTTTPCSRIFDSSRADPCSSRTLGSTRGRASSTVTWRPRRQADQAACSGHETRADEHGPPPREQFLQQAVGVP